MSKLKKMLSLVVAMVMVLAMSIPTFAATGKNGEKAATGTASDKGTITVSGVEETGVTVKAYQIIKAKYENGGKFSGYESLYPTIITDVTADDITVDSAQLADIIDATKVAGTEYAMTSAGGTTYTAEVPVGSYLVVISGAENKIYNPLVVSVVYKNKDGKTAMDFNEVDVTDTTNSWAKVSGTPVLDKKIVEGENKKVKGNTVNIGDTVNYELSTTIPYYGGNHPKFNIVDKLNGLTYTENSLKVTADGKELTAVTDYTLTVNGAKNEITVDFVVNGAYTLNQYQSKALVVTYAATVNQDAALNGVANVNDATLNFTKDSKVDGKDGSSNDKTYTYTFDIDGTADGSLTKELITKVGTTSSEQKVKLNGAEFTLYTDAALETVYGTAYPENEKFNGVVVTDANGQMTMTGLKAGTYYLKETKAPDGYTLNDTVYTIVIDATIDETTGKLTAWSISVNGATISGDDHTVRSTFTVTNDKPAIEKVDKVEIVNTKISNLPSTGGIGTTIFTIAGCLIMVTAAGLFFASRKRTNK